MKSKILLIMLCFVAIFFSLACNEKVEYGDIVYRLNDDNTEMTATQHCITNPKRDIVETVKTKITVITEADCEKDGLVEIDADFKKDQFEDQHMTVETARLAHVTGENGICKNCKKEILSFIFDEDASGYYVQCVDKQIKEVEIPVNYNDYPVVGILDYGFSNCTNLISITIPDRATLSSLHPQNNYCTL